MPDPVLGDMNYEHEFTNASYVDLGNGVRFPTGWHHHEGWDDNYQAQSINAGHNAFGGALADIQPNVCNDPMSVPDSVRTATFPAEVDTAEVASGVWLLGGSSHNSVAIEFEDSVAVVEAPLDEARSLAVIDAVVRLVPEKPIRFLVNTHQHHDHIGGLRTYHAHRCNDHHALEELRLLYTGRPELRATHTQSRHGVALAANRTRRGVPVRDGS